MIGRVHVPSSSRLLLTLVIVAAFGLSAAGAWGQTCSVTSAADTNTAGTLRYCLSNLVTGTAASTNTITFTVTGTITLTSGLPAINQGVTITGPGANLLTIDGKGSYQVFVIGSTTGVAADISGLTVINGDATNATTTPNGGGISVISGALTVTDCAFRDNSANAEGGAIFAAGTLTVSGCTFSGNSALHGGAIVHQSGTAAVTNSTFSGNSATGGGGAIYHQAGSMTVTNSTFSGNSAASGGAIDVGSSTASLASNNNLFAGNSATASGAAIDNSSSGTANADYNVYYSNLVSSSEDDCNSCTSNTNATSASSDPLALPLGNYGGITKTYLPQPGSDAICAGSSAEAVDASSSPLTADQRGFPLVNTCVDAGAVQTNYVQVQSSSGSGGSCPGSSCRLPTAIGDANTAGYGDIDFKSGVTSITASATLELSGTTGINIIGPGANALTIDGNGGNFSVFTVDVNVPAVLYGMTIKNGKPTSGSGGGISNAGDLTLLSSAVTGNTASAGDGGGIYNSGALLAMDDTISGNTSGSGGGVYSTGALEIVESTVSGNFVAANGAGGGINSHGTLTVFNSTIAGNSAGDSTNPGNGGGIDVAGGSATLANTIVSNNTVGATGGLGSNIQNSYTDNGGNVIGGSTDATNTLVGGSGAAITLGSLDYYPSTATVQTQIPLPGGTDGNPAICAGMSSNVSSSVTADERGEPISPNDCPSGAVDAGAAQTSYTMSFTANAPSSSQTVDTALTPSPEVTLNESGAALPSGSVDIPLTVSSGTLYGTTTETTASGVATYSDLYTGVGSSLTLGASLSLNAGLSPALSITATSDPFNVSAASTSVTVTASGSNPGSPVVNDSLTFIATLSPQNAEVPYDTTNGTVTFTDTTTGKVLCASSAITVTSGVASASCTTTALYAGSNKISAVYNGDTNYDATTSSNITTLNVTLGKADTSVAVSGPTTGAYGSSLSFNATVTPLNSDVQFTGTVTFTDTSTSTTLCSDVAIAASTGVATCQTSSLAQGSATISAVYNGDSNYNATTSGNVTTLSVLVGKANPTGSLTCTSNDPSSPACATSIALNSNETFTETVTGPNGATAPTGKVTFTDNGSTIAGCGGASGVSLSSGSAQCSTSLPGGNHSVVATYNGDSNYNSVTNSLSVNVGASTTTTAVTSSTAGSSTVNQSVTFNVTIAPANLNPAPTGTVTVVDTSNSNAQICTGTLASQSFSCSTQALALGTHNIKATYSGDSNYSQSSGTVTQTVTAGTATMPSLASSSNPAVVNNNVTFTATVSVPSGPTSPAGYVHFTSNNSTISGCDKVTLTLSSPGATSGTAQCTTSSLAASTAPYTIGATFTDTNGNFTQASDTLQQTVSAAATTVTIAAAPSTTTVNVPVTYTVTATAASTTYPLTGTVQIADNGNVVCSGLTLNQTSGSPTGTNSSCTESNLTAGVHTITATYNLSGSDVNNGSGSGSTTVPVAPAGTTVTVTSSLNPSVVMNPNNVNDTVTFTAMASTTDTLSVPFSGTLSFTANGLTIPGCSAVPVNSSGMAMCTASDLTAGADTILAVYSNDSNYTGSSGYLMSGNQITPQMVQDYSLVVSSTPPVEVSQGYTTKSDLFSAQTISVVPLSVQGFATQSGSPLALTCPTPTTVFSSVSSPTPPTCVLNSNSLPVSGTGAQGAVGIVVDATNASAGIYAVQVVGTDPTTGLVRNSTFTVIVRAASDPLTVVSGATTGNSGNLSFLLPAGVTLTNLACQSVAGPNLTGSVSPASLGISCSFNPTSITNSAASMQAVQVTVTVDTGGGSTTTAAISRDTNLYLSGLLGIPLFGLMGLIRRRKAPKSVFFQLIAIVVICFAAFQVMGCGGSFATQSANAGGGKTPPGVYKVLVVGTGSNGQTYQAELQLNVQL